MDGKGRYADNILLDRLWRTVKYEDVYFSFYNNQRPHHAVCYWTPAEVNFEASDEPSDESAAEPVGVLKGVSQSDIVVAKILPGIGNKIHVRGEGPDLSWDEGVPMSFLEIGKWGWSPPDKSTPIIVQLYRNDDEPDGNGKVELEPGEKVEITPIFEE